MMEPLRAGAHRRGCAEISVECIPPRQAECSAPFDRFAPDTIPNAGAYDGILGVVLAISLLEELRGLRFPFGIEVVGFSEEEAYASGLRSLAAARWSADWRKRSSAFHARGISVRQLSIDLG